jgi:hypothetical protein
MKLISLKSGWKTYAVVLAGVGFGAAQAFGVHIPGWLDTVLGFLGLGALRHGVQTQTATVIENVLSALTLPTQGVTLEPMTLAPTLTAADVHKAVADAMTAQRTVDGQAADKTQTAINQADDDAPTTKAALIADLEAGGPK